ncbi:MAG: PQQ-binding-like beta-propeller repeat protein, partial [Myxococcota bacterium]
GCDAPVFSCAASPDGAYVFAGDSCSSVYCFAEDGTRLWKLATRCGSAYSMQFFEDRLYIVTTDGSLACIDASEAAIEAAKAGSVPHIRDIKAPSAAAAVAVTTSLDTTRDTGSGVVLRCMREGGKLRVRVESPGYHSDWNVQFPRDIRQEGARYVVEEVREAGRGGFYRAHGTIRQLVD